MPTLGRATRSTIKVLRKVETQARTQFDATSGSFAPSGAAGVELYAGAANAASLRDSMTTRKTTEGKLRQDLAKASTPAERQAVEQQPDDNKHAERATLAAEQSLLTRLDDPAFIQGFGNNGGEEFDAEKYVARPTTACAVLMASQSASYSSKLRLSPVASAGARGGASGIRPVPAG